MPRSEARAAAGGRAALFHVRGQGRGGMHPRVAGGEGRDVAAL
jgi:hypothetical protein